MITTGSKFLLGASLLAAIIAVAYGISQDGVMGTVALVSAALALAFVAAVNVLLRDSNVFVDDELAVATCAAGRRAPGRSIWPMGLALAFVVLVLGLVTYQAVFVIGLLLLLATGGEWMLQAWSERASSDPVYNSQVRTRLAGPLEFPLAGALAIGILVYSFSRVMLWLSRTNTVIAFSLMAGMVLLFAFLFAFRPTVKKTAIAGISSVAVVAIVAGGVAAGVDGQREIEEHETTGGLVREGEEICESPEEFEADNDGSQSVSDSANVAARITLDEGGELTFTVPGGVESGAVALQIPRSNTTNVIFINESPEERRLSVDLGEIEVETEEGATGVVSNQVCTTLVEEDGQNLMTFSADVPSASNDGGYHFFVPGVDGAVLGLVVP
jgi:hypothetical protein